jgi:hypothetical protein
MQIVTTCYSERLYQIRAFIVDWDLGCGVYRAATNNPET